jgi:hypothetical protein
MGTSLPRRVYCVISSCAEDTVPISSSARSTSCRAQAMAASALSNSPRSSRMPPCPACALFMETMLYRGMAPFCASAAGQVARYGRELSSKSPGHAPKED